MNNPKDIINWSGLSRYLTGSRTDVSQNRTPKKYKERVDSLIMLIEAWQKEDNLNEQGEKKNVRG